MNIEQQIRAALTEKSIGLTDQVNTKSIRVINRIFRDHDQSDLYPINSEFNATDRAIRWYSRVYFRANGPCTVLEYIRVLDSKISEIVNSVW